MFNIKNILTVWILLIVAHAAGAQQRKLSADWMVLKEGELKVSGKTNINSFGCRIDGYSTQDTLTLHSNKVGDDHFQATGILSFNVNDFDCSNPIMNKELRKALKSNEFPAMTVSFISIDRLPNPGSPDQTIKGIVSIRLAGVTRKFEINCRFFEDEHKIVNVTCERYLNFTDFNIAPPKKFAGLLVTQDKLKVELHFGIKPAGQNFL